MNGRGELAGSSRVRAADASSRAGEGRLLAVAAGSRSWRLRCSRRDLRADRRSRSGDRARRRNLREGGEPTGALSTIAAAPLGGVALALIAVGLLAYAIWKLSQGVRGRGLEGGASPELTERVVNIGGGLAYLALTALAIRILVGSSGGSSGSPRPAAAGVLGWPGGPVIVGLVGGAVIIGALAQVYFAVRARFEKDSRTDEMDSEERRLFIALGRVGYCARALVVGVIGYFIVRTAVTYNPGNAVGFSGAITRLHHDAFGSLLGRARRGRAVHVRSVLPVRGTLPPAVSQLTGVILGLLGVCRSSRDIC